MGKTILEVGRGGGGGTYPGDRWDIDWGEGEGGKQKVLHIDQ